MTDAEKNAVNAAKLIREYCKATGCLYCIFHKTVNVVENHFKMTRTYCELNENYPRNWPEEIKEEESN